MEEGAGGAGGRSSNGEARPGRQEADPEQRDSVITRLVANRSIGRPARQPGSPPARPGQAQSVQISSDNRDITIIMQISGYLLMGYLDPG